MDSKPGSALPERTSNPVAVALVGGTSLTRTGIGFALRSAEKVRVALELPAIDSPPPRLAATPDVVVFDYEAFDRLPPAVIAALQQRWGTVPVIVLIATADPMHAAAWIRAGARGVMAREQSVAQLPKAVRAVALGELWIDRLTSARLIEELSAENRRLPSSDVDPRTQLLSPREHKVVALVAMGMSNKAVARTLGITENTVRHHLSSVFAKLQVHDRLGLALYAHRCLGNGSER